MPDDGNLQAGAFDEDKNPLFFVKYGAQQDALLFDGNGIQRGVLPAYQSITRVRQSGIPHVYPEWGREMAVVPVPGTCKRFYLFYVQSSVIPSLTCCLSFSVLLRATIDCAGTFPVILSPPTPVDESLLEPFYGIAISKEINGSRRLYFANNRNISSYTITSNGVSAATRYGLSSGSQMDPLEADLSPDGTKLAMTCSKSASAGGVGGIYLADINPTTGAASNLRTAGISTVQTFGVEFSPDSKKLYFSGKPVSGSGGLYELNLATNNLIRLTGPIAEACFGSQLELAYDGLIYAADDQDRLVALNPATNAVTVSSVVGIVRPVPQYCNSSSFTNRSLPMTRALPDQIDGQDYTFFFGSPSPQISNLNGGGKVLASSVFRNLYTCQAPLFLTASLANIVETRILVKQVDNLGSVVSGGYQNATSWLPVSTTHDLATLFGNYLANNPDYYQIILEGRTACNIVSRRIGLVRMNNAPPNSNFVFITGTENPSQVTPSQAPNSPSKLGGLGGAVAFTGTQGFDSYSISIDDYDTGSQVCSLAPANIPFGLTTIKFNDIAFRALGIVEYFAQPSSLNRTYKVSLSLTNGCGTSALAYGFFTPITSSYRVATGSSPIQQTASAYPNPVVAQQMRITYSLATDQPVQICILNALTGREVLRPLPRAQREKGQHVLVVDISGLPSGSYLYRIEAERPIVNRFTKSE